MHKLWDHFGYLWYVIKHKWYVLLECWRLGLYWRGLLHDLSKFRPSEWFAYVNHFYTLAKRYHRDEVGYYKPTDTGDALFDFAWFLHQKRNNHHWQYWTVPENGGELKMLPMPPTARQEMLADWRGAGRAQGTPDTGAWYRKHRAHIHLHPETRQWLEEQLG